MPKKLITPKFWPFLITLFTLALIYLILRIFPLLNHNVSYTYDQGRDFLKAAELVDQRNLTFIGPTTGIMGLYHGAWWYYILTIPYLLFGGIPIGFYYFNFLIHLLTFGIVLYLCYHEFGYLKTLLAGLLIAGAPYFIATSLFVGNNIFAIPSFLFFLVTLYSLAKHPPKVAAKKSNSPLLALFILNGFTLGLVAEFELSFGLFLLPSYLLTILVFPKLRKHFANIKSLLFFLSALGLAFLPRALYELKNGFAQARILWGFFVNPKLHNLKPYLDVFKDRLGLFQGYYESLFPYPLILGAVSLVAVVLLLSGLRQKQRHPVLGIFLFLLACLFFLSTLYKDNFWGNYYEGLHYLLLALILLAVSLPKETVLTKTTLVILNIMLLGTLGFQISKLNTQPRMDGLRAHELAVMHLYKVAKSPFCLDIYTPPAIPYTYRYLFYHQNRHHGKPLPLEGWQKGECWYFIENDDYNERRVDWIKSRIPAEATLKEGGQIGQVSIQLWRKQ